MESFEISERQQDEKIDNIQFKLDEKDGKIAEIKADIEVSSQLGIVLGSHISPLQSKKSRIAVQTRESGMDGTEIKALAQEKATLHQQLAMLNKVGLL